MITKKSVVKKLREVIDPELNINIIDLGLIYDINIYSSSEARAESRSLSNDSSRPASQQGGQARTIAHYNVDVKMTLTSPGCPLSFVFEEWIRDGVKKIKGVKNVTIDLVWEPAWSPERMTDEAREMLGIVE